MNKGGLVAMLLLLFSTQALGADILGYPAQRMNMQHPDEASRIWREFVPQAGQADTVQGELLRAVEKLRDEAIRNGNLNWDAGFEILVEYLEAKILDPAVYSETVLADTKSILLRLKNFEEPLVEDEPYDRLGDRVVEYFRHYGSLPNPPNPVLRR
jgi:hypothetical protein